jgi:hypothetical protein
LGLEDGFFMGDNLTRLAFFFPIPLVFESEAPMTSTSFRLRFLDSLFTTWESVNIIRFSVVKGTGWNVGCDGRPLATVNLLAEEKNAALKAVDVEGGEEKQIA